MEEYLPVEEYLPEEKYLPETNSEICGIEGKLSFRETNVNHFPPVPNTTLSYPLITSKFMSQLISTYGEPRSSPLARAPKYWHCGLWVPLFHRRLGASLPPEVI